VEGRIGLNVLKALHELRIKYIDRDRVEVVTRSAVAWPEVETWDQTEDFSAWSPSAGVQVFPRGGPLPPFGGKHPSKARRIGLLANGSSATAKQTASWAMKGLEPPAEAGMAVAPKAKVAINGIATKDLINLPRREIVSF
jgi:hypothetical protein